MKQASEIVGAVQNDLQTNSMTSPKKTSRKTDLPKHWTSEIFKCFQVRYGVKWTCNFEGVEAMAVAEWAKGLAGLTGEQIAHGLDAWQGAWPPSLPEFRQACLGKHAGFGAGYVPEVYRQPVVCNPRRMLSSDDRDARRAKLAEGFAGLRERLRGDGDG